MNKKIMSIIMAFVMATTPTINISAEAISKHNNYTVPEQTQVVTNNDESHLREYIEFKQTLKLQSSTYIEPEVAKEPEIKMSQEDIDLIALVTMAEAEGESELGKRLVIDTILNRVDHEKKWPNTVKGVIYEKGQFSSMWNGRVDRCYVRDDIVQLVREELVSRTNSKCVYFRMGDYHGFGTPLVKEGNHYFSGC